MAIFFLALSGHIKFRTQSLESAEFGRNEFGEKFHFATLLLLSEF